MLLCLILTLLLVNFNPAYIGKCYLDACYNCKIPLYETSSSSDIKTYVVNWYYTDDRPDLYVREIKDGRALIDAVYPEWDKKYHKDETGWIDMKYLCTSFNCGFLMKRLYSSPSRNSQIVCKIRSENTPNVTLKVLDMDNYWIKTTVPGTDIVCWLPPEFSSSTADKEDSGNLPRLFLDIGYIGEVPVYESEDGSKAVGTLRNDTSLGLNICVYPFDIEEKDERAFVYTNSKIVQGVDIHGWIDTKYLCTYLTEDYKAIDLLDCYEEGSVVYVIDNNDCTLPYHVVATWKIGWVEIIVPGTDIKGWLAPRYRSESPSWMSTR